jgi:hypothetical protein
MVSIVFRKISRVKVRVRVRVRVGVKGKATVSSIMYYFCPSPYYNRTYTHK